MKKLMLVILDGAADKGRSAYASAQKPHIDMLAANSACGLWTGVRSAAYNKRSMSSLATLEILGYSGKDEPGRGYLEALWLGPVPHGAVCLRGDFATLKDGKITDRRGGRDETGLDEIVHDINKEITSIGDVKTKVYRTVGHRFVLMLTGKGISRHVTDGDISDKPEKIFAAEKGAQKTSDVLNEFVERSGKLLASHPVNKRRKLPANFLLLRSAGSEQKVESFFKKYGMKACAISGVPIVIGICRYLGIDVIDTPPSQLEGDLFVRTHKAIDALEKYDVVLLHINGADIYAHDRDFEGKVSYLERIDAEVFSQITKLRHINIAVISDHITYSVTGDHEFGPVPFLVYGCEEEADGSRFDEKNSSDFHTDNPMKKIMSVIG